MDKPTCKIIYLDTTKKGNPQLESPPGIIIDEGAATVKFKPNSGKEFDPIPANQLVDVIYVLPADDLKLKGAYNAAATADKTAGQKTGKDRAKLLEDARSGYSTILSEKAGKLPKQMVRHLEYKVATITLTQASGEKSAEDKAVKLLEDFRARHPDAWQLGHVLERLADLQYARGDYKAAAKSYEDILSKIKGLAPETRGRYLMTAINAMVKAQDYKGAEARLGEVLKSVTDDSQKFSLEMLQLRCKANTPGETDKAIAALKKKIADLKEEEKYKKAVAHNTLGDCYLMTKKAEDINNALYEFLWVDVWYSGDKQETIKAYNELRDIYKRINKPARAKEYEEKLEKLKAR